MSRPRLLDLFCGAGGAAKGYQRAGFHVTGVDIKPMPRYCGDVFIQADALEFCREHGHEFDAIHASPPCQAYSSATGFARARGKTYPDLIAPTRAALIAAGVPYIIENVPGAPLGHCIMLCGKNFGLRTQRHRYFETSWLVFQPEHTKHSARSYNKNRKAGWESGGDMCITGDAGTWMGKEAMGIDWMTGNELSQAIPPAYTEYIGKQLMESIARSANA